MNDIMLLTLKKTLDSLSNEQRTKLLKYYPRKVHIYDFQDIIILKTGHTDKLHDIKFYLNRQGAKLLAIGSYKYENEKSKDRIYTRRIKIKELLSKINLYGCIVIEMEWGSLHDIIKELIKEEFCYHLQELPSKVSEYIIDGFKILELEFDTERN